MTLKFMKKSIWENKLSIEQLNKMSENTLQQYLEIEFIEMGDDYLKAKMPVNWKTHQPYKILHGGASVVLAETVGSMASCMCSNSTTRWLGLDINANHISPVSSGIIYCTATPVHIGTTTQIWEMLITTLENKIVCKSRLTMLAIKL
jgi:uncharacterized protein (TIGR00369 family)